MVLVWVLGAIPVLVIIAELVFALATSLGVVVSAAPPTSEEIRALVARPSGLLRSIGIDIDLVPIASEAIAVVRGAAASVEANIANIAAGAVAALGPVILAIGLGVILSANPDYVGVLNIFLPRASEASVHRTREVLESILARFIGRHLLLGLAFGLAAGLGALAQLRHALEHGLAHGGLGEARHHEAAVALPGRALLGRERAAEGARRELREEVFRLLRVLRLREAHGYLRRRLERGHRRSRDRGAKQHTVCPRPSRA